MTSLTFNHHHALKLVMIFLFLNLSACKSKNHPITTNIQLITSRDEGNPNSRLFIYQTIVPSHWIRKDPSIHESIFDTKKPNCEFFIKDNDQQIRITVHTFPYSDDSQRIPSLAQIHRWKKQFHHYNPMTLATNPYSHGGFHGHFFEVEGVVDEKPAIMMGWSMQLSSLYDRVLKHDHDSDAKVKRADYTIKVMGPPELVSKNREDIIVFGQQFEFIDELPLPL